jgi:hypothetical protein
VAATTVYYVAFDVEHYHSLLFDVASDAEFAEIPDLHGRRVADVWPTPAVIVHEAEGGADPDFWHLFSMGQAVVVAAPLVERLEPFLSIAGELLPLTPRNRPHPLLALNVLTNLPVDECIDLEQRADERAQALADLRRRVDADDYAAILEGAADGDPWPVLYPDFVADRLDFAPSFFRVDRLPASIFLLDWDEAEDTLLRRITRLALEGLAFERVWSTESGAEAVNFLG